MESAYAQRINTFGRIILGVGLVALVVWLQRLDSANLKQDVFDLNTLKLLSNLSVRDRQVEIQARFRQGLVKRDPKTAKSNDDVRVALSKWLEENGLGAGMVHFSGKFDESGVQGRRPFYCIELLSDLCPSVEESAQLDQLMHVTRLASPGEKTPRISQETVGDYLDKLNFFAGPTSFNVATSFTALALQPEVAAMPAGPPVGAPLQPASEAPPAPLVPAPGPVQLKSAASTSERIQPSVEQDDRLRSVTLRGSTIVIEATPPSATNLNRYPPAQSPPLLLTTQSLPAKATRIEGAASLLELSDENRSENSALLDLERDRSRVAGLRATYGQLPLGEAASLASAGMVRAYQNVDILGFSFSTKRLPFAVIFALGVALVGTFLVLRQSAAQSLRILSGVAVEDVFDMALDHPAGRVALWAVVPPLAIALTYPPVPISFPQTAIIVLAALALSAIGLACAYLARRL